MTTGDWESYRSMLFECMMKRTKCGWIYSNTPRCFIDWWHLK